jgi:phosphoesterase RecJ-like protein
MSLDWTPLRDFICSHERFLVTTHVRPDGDALGSEIGMAGLLEGAGKDVRIVNSSPTPPRYDFLDRDGARFGQFGGPGAMPENLSDRQAIVILDLSSRAQLGDMAGFVERFPGRKLIIDHHVSEDDLGAVVIKDAAAEATGLLVYDAARAIGIPVSQEMAVGLLTALAMDTGWFRHTSTRPRTFRAAAELLEAGADVHAIYQSLYERNSVGRLRMIGKALGALRTDLDGRVAYTVVTREDFQETGALPPDTEDLVDFAVSVKGVEVGMLFIEQFKGGSKLSLRSRGGFDCAALASRFGGGGHRAAAGANLPEPLHEMLPRVLGAVRSALVGNSESAGRQAAEPNSSCSR